MPDQVFFSVFIKCSLSFLPMLEHYVVNVYMAYKCNVHFMYGLYIYMDVCLQKLL